jgi:hypothetical protein
VTTAIAERVNSGRASVRGGSLILAGACAAAAALALTICFIPNDASAPAGSGQSLQPGLGTFAQRFPTLPDAQPGRLVSEAEIRRAKAELAQAMQVQTLQAQTPQAEAQQADITKDEATAVAVAPAIPLPRARPLASRLMASLSPAEPEPSSSPLSDVSSALRKVFAMLQPPNVKLASASSDGGISNDGQDRLSLPSGYDKQTAVYDISARMVYMPDGKRLEAHSGLGDLLDDPRHVDVHDRGATPPQVYDLKLREKPFHGVQALRMTPVGDGSLYGRSGLLAHSYMLGPNGDSNGCVSFKDYDAFLQAFLGGNVKRLVVVKTLANEAVAEVGKT